MICYSKATTLEDLKQILELQKKNLPENLSKKEKAEEGFVTVNHTLSILKKMNDVCPHSIAKYNNRIIGYALSMTKEFASDIEILKPMFIEISKVINEENYVTMGQICIDKSFRKKGVFKGLYQIMKTNICNIDFDLIITEIDITNLRSLKAHESVGFNELKTYNSNNTDWVIVSLKV